MHPILVQAGPFTVGTHDAFSLLARRRSGSRSTTAELRRRGWLGGARSSRSRSLCVVGGVIGARVITAWEHRSTSTRPHRAGLPLSWVLDAQRQEPPRRAGRRVTSRARSRSARWAIRGVDRRRVRAGDPGRDGHRADSAASSPSCPWDADRPAVGCLRRARGGGGVRRAARLHVADAPVDALRGARSTSSPSPSSSGCRDRGADPGRPAEALPPGGRSSSASWVEFGAWQRGRRPSA